MKISQRRRRPNPDVAQNVACAGVAVLNEGLGGSGDEDDHESGDDHRKPSKSDKCLMQFLRVISLRLTPPCREVSGSIVSERPVIQQISCVYYERVIVGGDMRRGSITSIRLAD